MGTRGMDGVVLRISVRDLPADALVRGSSLESWLDATYLNADVAVFRDGVLGKFRPTQYFGK
jgi:hypothetical protein